MSLKTAVNNIVLPTCSAACPVLTDTREYVQRISRGDYEGALDILLEVNPFPSVCGRICHHPCENECRRKEIDQPVSLRLLKRFVVENTVEYRKSKRKRPELSRGKSVAVIGAGPSGLTAAKDLAMDGYRVEVFDKEDRPGGMLAYAIPKYRLPAEALEDDINEIIAAGVNIRTKCKVGRDVTFSQLRKDYDALLIAVGLSDSHSLSIPGFNSSGVKLGLEFLWEVASGSYPELGDSIIVIGGGNVAIDTARTAKRLSPDSKVYMACLESREEMPAWSWEIREAEEEGIEILNSWGPKAIQEINGKTTCIEFRKCVSVFDQRGHFYPRYDEETTTEIRVDNVIVTIGQKSNLEFLQNSSVAMDRGKMIVDRDTMKTSAEGVFCTGEVAAGPGAAIQAVASGHRAAKIISNYLENGRVTAIPEPAVESVGSLPADVAEKAKKIERLEVSLVDPETRIKDFSPIEHGYDESEALREARRCLSCATGATLADSSVCAGCLTCVRVCPFGVATVRRTAAMPSEKCQTCGLCAAECPAAAIALARFAVNEMKNVLNDILQNIDSRDISSPFIVSYCCLNETTSRKFIRQQSTDEIIESGILRILVPCVGRLGARDIIAPFEIGADGVAVISCKENKCVYTGAEELLKRRVYKSKKFLKEIGVEMKRLQFYYTRGSAEESWPDIWAGMKELLTKVEA